MELQFHGANCITLTYKGVRVIIDDNLADLGAKGVSKAEDIAVNTTANSSATGRLVLDGPGEYEVSDVSVVGIASQAHMDEPGRQSATMYKLMAGDISIFVTGHIYPDITDKQLEQIGIVDVLFVPVGGNGYTLDPVGALKIIKAIEPKIVIPTHYADKAFKYPVPQQDLANALKELGMEPKETVPKLKIKAGELPEITQLIVLEKS